MGWVMNAGERNTTLILLRHGESAWNKFNIFTGWVDIPLTVQGVQESLNAGEAIRDTPIDVIYTSSLIRTQMTAMLAMMNHSSGKVPAIQHPGHDKVDTWAKIYGEAGRSHTIPMFTAWELNERMYGELQGCDKDETRRQFGADQVKIWRRSYDVAPPQGESLEMTAARTIPYFRGQIIPHLEKGKNVLIVAHGNSLRSIIMDLDKLTREQVLELEIPLGLPILYRYRAGALARV